MRVSRPQPRERVGGIGFELGMGGRYRRADDALRARRPADAASVRDARHSSSNSAQDDEVNQAQALRGRRVNRAAGRDGQARDFAPPTGRGVPRRPKPA